MYLLFSLLIVHCPLTDLSRKFTDDSEYISAEIKRSGPGTLMFALRPEHITGKWVREA